MMPRTPDAVLVWRCVIPRKFAVSVRGDGEPELKFVPVRFLRETLIRRWGAKPGREVMRRQDGARL
jgi:hypothetical protein